METPVQSPQTEAIIHIIRQHYADVQAIYLFGTYGTPDEWPDSDVDIAILLPPEQASEQPQTLYDPCAWELAETLDKSVDLLNARRVSTVFQKEIVATGRLLYCADETAVAEFEMLTLSYYQQLNDERREILKAFHETGKAYQI